MYRYIDIYIYSQGESLVANHHQSRLQSRNGQVTCLYLYINLYVCMYTDTDMYRYIDIHI